MEALGAVSLVFVLLLWSRVKRLERILRENGIRPAAEGLGRQLGPYVGRDVLLSLSSQDGAGLFCRVLDADEAWALLLCDSGKKKERRMLIRLEDVSQVRLTAPRWARKGEKA